MEIIRRN